MQAFRHASYVNEQADTNLDDNERLEFLGDAVLDLAVSHLLMERFQGAEEGDLSKFRARVVDETGLCEVALGLGLGDYLLLGKGEDQGRGREKPSILANTTEALMGALYLDAGFDKTMEIVGRLFSPLLDRVGGMEMDHDFKSLLQEYTQQTYRTLPEYRLTEESGPAHDKTFRVMLTLKGEGLSEGVGKSKKEAEQKAAREAFLCLQGD
ncbi:MAG: ribonuclease III [Deltaproteobacteria bacterium]|nr:ribonuclease III [Deltaproteobacteria bacterium]